MSRGPRRVAGALAVAAALSCVRPARAQAAAVDPATAEALFEDGKRLMQAHQYAEACPKLVESQRLDPGAGTLLVLAMCDEGAGRTATAWAEFTDALAQARRDQRKDREAAAAEHVHALEARLTRMRVTVAHDTNGLEVRRNNIIVGRPQWSTAIPVDPGQYAFTARAPGKMPWSATISLQQPGGIVDVAVPALQDLPPPVVANPAPARPIAIPVVSPPAHAPEKSWLWSGVTLGIGAASTAAAAILGGVAASDWSSAQQACPKGACKTSSDAARASTAGSIADASTGLFVVGGALLATGGVLVILNLRHEDEPPPRSSLHLSPTFGPTGAGMTLGGSL